MQGQATIDRIANTNNMQCNVAYLKAARYFSVLCSRGPELFDRWSAARDANVVSRKRAAAVALYQSIKRSEFKQIYEYSFNKIKPMLIPQFVLLLSAERLCLSAASEALLT